MLPSDFLANYESELRFITLQTRREDMQWRREPKSPAVDEAVAKSEELNQHLSKSVQMLRAQAGIEQPAQPNVTPLPTVSPTDTPQPTRHKPMTDTPATGFAAELKAMLDGAKAGLNQARADGKAKIQTAVGKFAEATASTVKVTDNMAKTIEDEAASAMSELGQISNDL